MPRHVDYIRQKRIERSEDNKRSQLNIRGKEEKVKNTHATIQRAYREKPLPHVVHIHAWRIKETEKNNITRKTCH